MKFEGWRIKSVKPPDWADAAVEIFTQDVPVALVAFRQTSLCPQVFYLGLLPGPGLTAEHARALRAALDYLAQKAYALKATAQTPTGKRFLSFLGFKEDQQSGYYWR